MVATVVKLRFRAQWNSLSANVWRLIGFAFGVVGGLGGLALVMVLSVFAAASGASVDTKRLIMVALGSLVLIGWVLGPVLVAGIDSTVDADRLASFPLSMSQVMVALAAVGLTGVPGIVTTATALIAAIAWLPSVAAMAVAVPAALVAAATCVVASRAVGALATGLGSNRRGREAVSTVLLVVLMFAGPITLGVLYLLDNGAGILDRLSTAIEILAWTPLGASWAVPADFASGNVIAGLGRAAIAVGTLGALWATWRWALLATLTSPPQSSSYSVARGKLGWFGRLPTGPVGATWARSLASWFHDPRYSRQLILIPILPVVFAFTGGVTGPMFIVSAVVAALTLALATYTDLSYDGTAFATVLASGIRGRDDRLGRLLGSACLGLPLVLIIAVVTAGLAGAWSSLPAIAGASLAVVLAGLGVTAVSSALIISPVPEPGANPFKSVPGQTFVNGLLVFVVVGATVAVSVPSLGLFIAALLLDSIVLGWVTLAVGIATGFACTWGGITIGGRIFDHRAPELLAAIKELPR
ncbi:MAG: hypothetical protein ACK5KU_11350 [Beutenbergiaceae bacterium]